MRKETRNKRLKELKYVLNNHAKLFDKVQFTIDMWYVNKHGDVQNRITKRGCDTAACALGSAALYKPFNNQGLALETNRYGENMISYKKRTFYEAGAAFFGISKYESEYLFAPRTYTKTGLKRYSLSSFPKVSMVKTTKNITAKKVAERVGILIKHYSKNSKPLNRANNK